MTAEQFQVLYKKRESTAKNNRIIEKSPIKKYHIKLEENTKIISFRISRCTYCDIRQMQTIFEQDINLIIMVYKR